MFTLLIVAAVLALQPAIAQSSCTVKNGQVGECISTSTCSSQGGKSEAGHCPGSTDTQVGIYYRTQQSLSNSGTVLYIRLLPTWLKSRLVYAHGILPRD